MLRRHAGKDDLAFGQQALQLEVAHRIEFSAGEDGRLRGGEHADAPGHRLRSETIVAGDHRPADAGLAAAADGLGHLWPRRIHHRHQSQEGQLLLNGLRAEPAGACRQRASGQSQHTQRVAGVVVIGGQDQAARLLVKRDDFALLENRGAQLEDLARRALDVGHHTLSGPVQRGHALAPGIEGQLVHAGQLQGEVLVVQAALEGEHAQRGLGLIAQARPVRMVGRGRIEAGVVAQQGGRQQLFELGAHAGLVWRRGEPAVRLIAHAGDGHPLPGDPHFSDRHLVLGQGAALVGRQHRDRAQRLDHGQLLDQHATLRQALHGNGQRQGDRGRQAFGHGGDHDPGRQQEGLEHGQADFERPDPEDADADGQGDQGDAPRQPTHLALQGAGLLADLLGQADDAAELGEHPRGVHHRSPGSRDDRRSRKDQVRLFELGEVLSQGGIGGPARGDRLAGERGVIGAQAELFDDASVGRDVVALSQNEDIAGHNLAGGNLAFLAVADQASIVGQQHAQRLHRLLRPVLLPEGEGGVDQHDDPDGQPQHRLTGDECNQTGRPQHKRHQVRDVPQQQLPQRQTGGFGERIGAVQTQGRSGLILGQAVGGGLEGRVDLTRSQGMQGEGVHGRAVSPGREFGYRDD